MPEEIDRFAVTLETGSDDALTVEWKVGALAALADPEGPEHPPPWRIDGPRPDWSRWQSLRVLSAAFEDGALLACAALRPLRAKGHDDDRLQAVLVRDSTPLVFEELLLSAQFDGNDALARVNVEAYLDADSVPIRASGDVIGMLDDAAGEDWMEVNLLVMRMGGHVGAGTVDVLRPA